MISIFDRDAHLNDAVPEAYRGLERFEARKRVVADLEALGLVEKIDAHRHTVPHGDRSGVAIEPFLTDQWYVDAATLAQPAIRSEERRVGTECVSTRRSRGAQSHKKKPTTHATTA